MYAIRAAIAADLDEVVDLLVRLQAEPAHHIAYHGETAEAIVEDLTGMRPDWPVGTVLAVDSTGRVRGALSVQTDAEAGRAWLHGPYVDVPANHPAAGQLWQQTADALLDAALRAASLTGITDLELCGHRQHRLLADFAARHDFRTGRTSRVFVLTGAALRGLLVHGTAQPSVVDQAVRELPPGDGELRAAVAALYRRSFPDAPMTPRQLVEGARGHLIMVLTGPAGLIGFAAGYPQEGEFYVDLVAVHPDRRSRGAGRALVRGLLRALAARHAARAQAAAVITLGNDASERMFTALGFTLHLELVGYRQALAVTAR